ncbi:MAG: hypothetical protein LVQ95_00385 [Candidatus Micrarchaeales archaeon]|nr:hypothetical protein [Candidatus Micrarchaeales archaeon]
MKKQLKFICGTLSHGILETAKSAAAGGGKKRGILVADAVVVVAVISILRLYSGSGNPLNTNVPANFTQLPPNATLLSTE